LSLSPWPRTETPHSPSQGRTTPLHASHTVQSFPQLFSKKLEILAKSAFYHECTRCVFFLRTCLCRIAPRPKARAVRVSPLLRRIAFPGMTCPFNTIESVPTRLLCSCHWRVGTNSALDLCNKSTAVWRQAPRMLCHVPPPLGPCVTSSNTNHLCLSIHSVGVLCLSCAYSIWANQAVTAFVLSNLTAFCERVSHT
jgi:hypothetical protein